MVSNVAGGTDGEKEGTERERKEKFGCVEVIIGFEIGCEIDCAIDFGIGYASKIWTGGRLGLRLP